ncbi:MAG: DNA helicase RecG [Candidatus Pacebacteria bacterium CG10_big_fil_rev_8_21_14_0_10_56_10]|nr:MAG: DNA helicase RecG [Candidatus Pacebacteria bacterium CG10_big_fil_rev_8_21_14_0_10_56_10]
MYRLSSPLPAVKGIGQLLAARLETNGLFTVQDLLLCVPYRYEDRSVFKTVAELELNQTVSVRAKLDSITSYYKGGRSIQRGRFSDRTGQLNTIWFNNQYLARSLRQGRDYIVSGQLGERGAMVQPLAEPAAADTIHTGRIVPIYSSSLGVKLGTVRRLLKEILDGLRLDDQLAAQLPEGTAGTDLPLDQTFRQLHFPDSQKMIELARQRLALEELLGLIVESRRLKRLWRQRHSALALPMTAAAQQAQHTATAQLPFNLTRAQQRAISEALTDMARPYPMNRLLVGDVGSGKTAVAGLLCYQAVLHGQTACLVAPTRVLAQQHVATLEKLLPSLPVELITGSRAGRGSRASQANRAGKTGRDGQVDRDGRVKNTRQPRLVIGTHAVINQLRQLQPGLMVFDEQHRFGVSHRSRHLHLEHQPHVLTMTATPIPRSLMLTIFSHLELSSLDELPAGRRPVKTWLVPSRKRRAAYRWLVDQLGGPDRTVQAIVVCPFIDPSHHQALENIAAATETHRQLTAELSRLGADNLRVELLHGRLGKKQQQAAAAALYDQQVDVLVTTPMVEVGVDLPAAAVIVIEAAERYGLASLHQLRGRVGRAGQQGYCLLFSSGPTTKARQRLKYFTQTTDGNQLAEYDLKHRGAGNIFGTEQTGFGSLRFASWANLSLITQARRIADQLPAEWQSMIKLAGQAGQTKQAGQAASPKQDNNRLLIAPS